MRFTGNRKWPALTVLGKNVADFVELLRGVIRLMDNKLITSFPAFFVQCVETGKEIVKAMSSSNDIIKLVKAEKTCQIDIRSIRRSIRRFLAVLLCSGLLTGRAAFHFCFAYFLENIDDVISTVKLKRFSR